MFIYKTLSLQKYVTKHDFQSVILKEVEIVFGLDTIVPRYPSYNFFHLEKEKH